MMSTLIKFNTLAIFMSFSLILPLSASEKPNGEKLFKQKCSLCHAIDKKKLGPAVNAMSKDKAVLLQVITKGKKPMPSYEGKLTSAEINALVSYLLANQ